MEDIECIKDKIKEKIIKLSKDEKDKIKIKYLDSTKEYNVIKYYKVVNNNECK